MTRYRLLALCLAILASGQPAGAGTLADWAYPTDPAAAVGPAPAPSGDRLHLPGSSASYTRAQLDDLFAAPDWRPADHPPMPAVVAEGRKQAVMACGYCHLPTGDGRPENAALAGESRDYIVEQMQAFRVGTRASTVKGRAPTDLMVKIAKAATDTEIETAAGYFARLPRHAFVRVVEAATVPRSIVAGWVFQRDPRGGVEPIGARIVEMPEDREHFERRNPQTRYFAFVPPGSIARGADLVRTWGPDGQFACTICHGAKLDGEPDAPGLAGRSPTFVARQLSDLQSGTRTGPATAEMAAVAKAMGPDDIVAIAAYLGSLPAP